MALKPYDIAEIYADMELELIEQLSKALRPSADQSMEEWQITKLREIRAFQERNKKTISKYQKLIDKQTEIAIRENFDGSYTKAERLMRRMIDEARKKLGKTVKKREGNFFKINNDKVNALIKSVLTDFNKGNASALRLVDDVYRQTLFKAQMYYVNGAVDLPKAIDLATKDFLEKGINSITYKDGRQVNISSYAEMNLRTANQRTTIMADASKRDEYGIHTVVTAKHGNTCPICARWQGKVLIDDVYSNGSRKDGKYPLLSTAVADGFLHPNGVHHPTTWFEGVNQTPTPPTQAEQAKSVELYNAEQRQRAIERDIRRSKRLEVGSLSEEDKLKARQDVRKYQARMREHLEQYPQLRRLSWREQI